MFLCLFYQHFISNNLTYKALMSMHSISMTSFDQISERILPLADTQFAALQNTVQELNLRIQHLKMNQQQSKTTYKKQRNSEKLLLLEQLLLALQKKIQIIIMNVTNRLKIMSHQFQDKMFVMQSINHKLRERIQYLEQNATKQVQKLHNQYELSFSTLSQNAKRIQKSLTEQIQYFELKFANTTQKQSFRQKDYLQKLFKLEKKVQSDKESNLQFLQKINNLQEEVILLKRQINDQRNIKKTFQNQFGKLSAEISQLQIENTKLKQQISLFSAIKQQLMNKIKQLQKQDRQILQIKQTKNNVSHSQMYFVTQKSSLNQQNLKIWLQKQQQNPQTTIQSQKNYTQKFLQEFNDSQQQDSQDIFIR